jgi:peptidoglycan/xylan/chitin deacetylase (PgdA/CDA1 family)
VNVLRRAVWRLLAEALGVALRLTSQRAGLVLVYHTLAQRSGDPGRELVAPHAVSLFEAQLRHLRRRYRVVAIGELRSAVASRRRGGRFPVAVTFDDDLDSHVALAAPILARLHVPATFFLTGASLAERRAFWWQQLQRASDLGLEVLADTRRIHEVAASIEAMSPAERERVEAQLTAAVGLEISGAGLGRTQVEELVAGGFGIGFHTVRHDRLADLEDAALRRALTDGRAELEEVVGRSVTTIAYPHGKADERVAQAARDAGFELGFTGSGEAVAIDSNPLLLGRFEPTRGPVTELARQLVWTLLQGSHR